jgi:uncharacterized protein (DUF1800 family)
VTLLLAGARFRTAEEALEPWRPGVDGPFGAAEAAHLLRRTAHGSTAAERARVAALGPLDAVADLTADQPPGGDFAALLAALQPLAASEDLPTCQALWLARLLHAPRPFADVLALFWHGHFATSVAKVGRAGLLVRQVELLRRLGPGALEPLLAAIARDPAMIVWLDGNSNRRHHPNENFARELLELFTLGRGNYGERDVLEAARAFSGWHERDGEFRFVPGEHDDGDKHVLGARGALDGDDVVRACLAQPACARHVAGRLFAHFVRPDPEPELLEVLAARYRAGGHDTRALLATLLASRAFFEPRARRALVASPVAFGIGAARSLGLRPDLTALADRLAGLGQSLYAPPSVKGWDGGMAWVNAATLVGRVNLAAWLGQLAAERRADVEAAAGGLDAGALAQAVLDGPPPPAAAAALDEARDDLAARVQVLLCLPEAQLA